MKRLSWELIQKFYIDNFGIDGWLVELYANQDILVLCASGTSNENISKFTEIPLDEIQRVLKNTLDFGGWESDLPTNPYKLYNELMERSMSVRKLEFLGLISSALVSYPRNNLGIQGIDVIYNVCKAVWEIESKIKDEWI